MKGQISIDLIMTIVVILIVFGGITAVLGDLITTQEKLTVRSTLSTTADELAQGIISAQAFKDTNFYLEVPLTPLLYKDKISYPLVTIDANTVTVREQSTGDGITVVRATHRPAYITTTVTPTMVVIRHA